MDIRDYETGKELRDLTISLTPQEAGDMIAYLQRLVSQPGLVRVHLSEVKHHRIDKEITFALDERRSLRKALGAHVRPPFRWSA